MKTLLSIAFAMAMSTQAHASQGGFANDGCAVPGSSWSSRFGLQNIAILKSSLQDQKLLLEIAVTTGTCIDGHSALMPPFTPVTVAHQTQPDTTIRVTPKEVSLRLYRDGIYKMIDHSFDRSRETGWVNIIRFEIDLPTVLKPQELAALERHESVTITLPVFLTRKLSFENVKTHASGVSVYSTRPILFPVVLKR